MYRDGTIELKFEELNILSTELGEESSVPDLLGEVVLQNSLEFFLDEEDEIYEGYGRRENAYPYRQFNQYAAELEPKKVQAAVLENNYLKATFLPEYGGRLWSLIDKETGKNLLYTNDVLQFRNLAVRNAWFSGGVEWNIGVIGHSPLTTAPLYLGVLENEKGNAVLRMYEYERIREVFYQMDFWLDEEDRYLNCRMRIVNENKEVVPMYWWSNIAVPEFQGGRIIVPAKKAFTFADGKVIKVDIPFVDGIDVTQYNGIPNSVDYFFEIEEDSPKYIANVDMDGFGLLQISTSRLKSRKLFSWGHSQGSKHWQEFLTKDAGDYVEIQAGLAKTQYGCLPMAPHTAWEWMEQYGPAGLSDEELNDRVANLEKTLRSTKSLAKTKCKLIARGSEYGFFAERKLASHLEFSLEKESLKKWKRFLETGVLHKPDPRERPDEFLEGENIFRLLKETIDTVNKDNWYAHYQLGVRYCVAKEYRQAVLELKESFRLELNAWACHALASVFFMSGEKGETIQWVSEGLKLEKKDTSYLKEMFKLLSLCGGYQQIVGNFEGLDHKQQGINRLKFYYISAKYRLGCCQEAYELLEQDGGLFLEDIREGEDSIQQLWTDLNAAVSSEEKEVPYRYMFRAY